MSEKVTRKERDCLLIVGEHNENFPLRLIDLSKSMGIKPPTAINVIKRLEDKGLLLKEKGMIEITQSGSELYNEIMENHRVLESLLNRYGIDIKKCCEIASSLDYLIDHDAVDKIFDGLGKPSKCPHGRNIEQFHD
ncbi:metal-dependent transcriptional regulator [Caldiplasma sukawensis]